VLCEPRMWRGSRRRVQTGGVVNATYPDGTEENAMNTGSEMTTAARPTTCGSLDGVSAGDHDTPYCFGRMPNSAAPFPFTTRQYARLLVLRSRVRGELDAADSR
jgi:hypothetical protein